LLTAYDDHCFYSFINYAQYSVVYSLSLHDALPILWQARLAIEAFAGPEAREIVQRWREADPESVPALMAAITIHDAHGEREDARWEEHTSELQSRENLVCRLLLEKKKLQTK